MWKHIVTASSRSIGITTPSLTGRVISSGVKQFSRSSSSATITTTSTGDLSTNPLMNNFAHPKFTSITAQHVVPAATQFLNEAKNTFASIEQSLEATNAKGGNAHTWQSLIEPLEVMNDKVSMQWEIVSHLSSVRDSTDLRGAVEKIEPEQVTFGLKVAQSVPFYDALQQVRSSSSWPKLDEAQKRVIDTNIESCRLAGVGLKGEAKVKYNTLSEETTKLMRNFANNILDANKQYKLKLTKPSEIEGLPERVLAEAALKAKEGGDDNANAANGPWVFTCDAPSYLPFMQFAKNRDIRYTLWKALNDRATSGATNNTPVITDILDRRQQISTLIGFDNYASLNLSNKLVQTLPNVNKFMNELVDTAFPHAITEADQLLAFAKLNGFTDSKVRKWDVHYYSQQMKEKKLDLNEELLRPYFQLPVVLNGLFALAERLFGLSITRADGEVDVWHPDVQFFRVSERNPTTGVLTPIFSFYLDPYSRPAEKRQGAWMNGPVNRTRLPDGSIRLPVTWLVCNQSSPVGNTPSLMSLRDVETLFHEFGHALQHMCTKVNYSSVAGIRGVEWDAVELPSQFMENWVYDRATMNSISKHVTTGEVLPDHLFAKVVASKQYRAAMRVVNQLYYSISDMDLHSVYPSQYKAPLDVPRGVVNTILKRHNHLNPNDESLMGPEPTFLNSFLHLFAGGYAANYYSYLYAEVMSADAFAAFEEAGLDNKDAMASLGQHFKNTILGLGGGVEAGEVFRRFRGRAPSHKALLSHLGIIKK